MTISIMEALKRGLIVSCQAPPEDPFYGSEMMLKYALSAQRGGAAGIRANSPKDISAIQSNVDLPLIGLWKRDYDDSDVYITPTFEDAEQVLLAGADIIAMDATARTRPHGQSLQQIVNRLRATYDCLLMADVSTCEEGLQAARLGFDIISTTLSGYTPYSRQSEEPDFQLISDLAVATPVPIFAEGRVHSPEQMLLCLERGAYAVVIGTAITRPQLITERFVQHIQSGIR